MGFQLHIKQKTTVRKIPKAIEGASGFPLFYERSSGLGCMSMAIGPAGYISEVMEDNRKAIWSTPQNVTNATKTDTKLPRAEHLMVPNPPLASMRL